MLAYIARRLLWMVPTFLAILLINFGFLRMRTNPLASALSTMGDSEGMGAIDPELVASGVESALSKARRTGQDLPALVNLRGFVDKEEIVTWLRSLERGGDVAESERRQRERELWLQGRFAVEPLYQVLDDPSLKELHGVASLAFTLDAFVPLNVEDLARLDPEERRRVQLRNSALRAMRIAHLNAPEGGFAITDPEYDQKIARIRAFWDRYGDDYRVDGSERWTAIVAQTGIVDFFGKLLTGNLYSYERKRYVFDLIAERWHVTFWLQFVSYTLAWAVAIPLGIRSARRRGTLEDNVTTNALFLLWSLPEFFVGSLLLHHFATDTASGVAIFPNRGLSSEGSVWMSTPRYLLDVAWHGLLPLVVLSYGSFTALSRYMRGSMLDQFGSDYVRTAKAKGADPDRVVYGHVLRNSMVTMVTLGASLLSALFGGFVIVEYIFSINGLGTLLLEAARAQDAPLVMGSTIISVLLLLVGILLADIMYAVVDPRIRSRYA